MIDLHCHILPGVDDGPATLQESLAMAEAAWSDGIRTMVATPHMLNGIYRNNLETVLEGVARLKPVLAERGPALDLRAGGDVHVQPNMVRAIQDGEAATVNNARRYILLELPFQSVAPGIQEEVFQLKIHGITPIITHPERNPVIAHDPERLAELVKLGCLSQVTAMSLTGGFGEDVQRVGRNLLMRGLVHILASDAHSALDRPPVLSSGVEAAAAWLGDADAAERMVTAVPAAVLAGEPVEVSE